MISEIRKQREVCLIQQGWSRTSVSRASLKVALKDIGASERTSELD
jgi:hypothetical protein